MPEFTLFVTAFLAATILPFSSEAAFVIALKNDMPTFNALFFASFGNVLAIIFNYLLGYFLYTKTKDKLLSSKLGNFSYEKGHKYAYYALLLSWLPLIGDPLTLVAGVLRLKFIWFLLIAGVLRILRYYFLTLMV